MENEVRKKNDEVRENPEQTIEEEPKHSKNNRLYFSVLMLILIGSLIYSGFSGTGGVEKEKKSVDAVIQSQTTTPSNDEDLFEPHVNKRKSGNRGDTQNKTQKGSGSSQTESGDKKNEKEERWKEQERERALLARKSKFRLRRLNTTDEKPQQNKSDGVFKNEFSDIDKQMALIDKEYNKTLAKLNNRDQFASNFGYQPEPKTRVVIGKPLSASKPRPGQKKIPTGRVISAVLDQDLTSDYTGSYRGRIAHDVYDVTGHYILIPKGSLFTGKSLRISNVNEPIQARMGLTVNWIVLGNGNRISFEKSAALDGSGVHGIKDRVNHHFLAQFLGVAAYALVSSESSRAGSGISQDKTVEGELGEGLRGQFSSFANKYLSLVPTITLEAGKPLKIFIEDDIYVDVYKETYDSFFTKN